VCKLACPPAFDEVRGSATVAPGQDLPLLGGLSPGAGGDFLGAPTPIEIATRGVEVARVVPGDR
jgi:hypothetical protein